MLGKKGSLAHCPSLGQAKTYSAVEMPGIHPIPCLCRRTGPVCHIRQYLPSSGVPQESRSG